MLIAHMVVGGYPSGEPLDLWTETTVFDWAFGIQGVR